MNFITKIGMLLAALPVCAGAVAPRFYLPLDGTPEIIGPNGQKIAQGVVYGKQGYTEGVVGQGLDVTRHAYDQVTAMSFGKLPDMDWNRGTVAFWFKPHWNENDKQSHWIFSGADWGKFRFYLIKNKSGMVELSVCAPGQVQILKRNLLKENTWAHLAFSWDLAKSEVKLYLNGKEIGTKSIAGKLKPVTGKINPACWFGQAGSDRFKAVVGNGVYDEARIFAEVLPPEEIFELVSGGKQEEMTKLSPDSVLRRDDRTELVFNASEKRFAGPKKLFRMEFADSEITLTAMGNSGKLSLRVEQNNKKFPIDLKYILSLKEPHKLTLIHADKTLNIQLDGAEVGKIELPKKISLLQTLHAAKEITLAQPDKTSAKLERISSVEQSKLEESLWSLKDAEQRRDGVRNGICLNGVWRTIPVHEYSYLPPAGKWGYMRVPGSFRSPLFQIYSDTNSRLTPLNGRWKKEDLIKFRAGWYQRTVKIPKAMRGKRIYLNFRNLNGDFGRVYFNGKLVDHFYQEFNNYPSLPNDRRIDVTELAGKQNLLTVFLFRDYIGLWKGVPSIGDHGEIAIGDVWLESAPSEVFIAKSVALPSFRRKEVAFRARIANPARIRGNAELTVAFERDGETEKTFRKSFPLDGSPESVIEFRGKWENPVLWDVENPNLYLRKTSLSVNGIKADDFPVQKFGFREAWVENGEFRMNGNKTRLRMWSSPGLNRLRFYYGDPRAVHQYVAHVKKVNYDTVRFDPVSRTSQVCWDDYLDECDRQGLQNLFPMPPYEDENQEKYSRDVVRWLEHYGNHPSILMWYTDFNTCGYPWGQDPAKLNDTQYDPPLKRQARARVKIAEKVMRSLDGSRELFQHAGGNSGKIFTSMNYQSFGTPFQEQEDWPKQWSKKHTQPLMVVESGFPFGAQFTHFDDKKQGLLAAEHAARYFGDSVFQRENRPEPYSSTWMCSPYANWPYSMKLLMESMYRRIVPAWRAYDVSAIGDFPGARDLYQTAKTYDLHSVVYGRNDRVKTAGIKPDVLDGWSETQRHLLTDYSQPGYLYDTLRTVFDPLLVFLGGDPEDFTSKDHAFFSGEAFRKSIVAVNDRTTRQDMTFLLRMEMDGKTVLTDTRSTFVEPGGILKLPVEMRAPQVFRRTEAVLKLAVLLDGELIREDSMNLQFFPAWKPKRFRDVRAAVYDPEGRTVPMLKQAGFPFVEAKTLDDVKNSRLLIIGKNALKNSNPELLKQVENAGLFEQGLKLLFFEQEQCNLGNLVFESPSARNAFPRRPESPYLKGLAEADFSDWRGSADSVPEYVLSAENSPHYPRSKWKCGNGGIVAGNVIRKPGYGNFRAIADCGFNLMFTPLMELRKGHGLALFCQFDVTNRYGKDPAATRLVDNILEEMSNPFVPVGPQRVGYIGNAEGEKILKRMGMVYRPISGKNPGAVRGMQVVVLGPGAGDGTTPEKLRKTLEGVRSKTTFVALPGADLGLFPGGLKTAKKQVWKASVPQNDPVFAGIPAADLYFRRPREMTVLDAMPDWAVATVPAIFAKVDLVSTALVILNVSPETVEGLWNDEKISRVWSAIFTNMNVGLGKDLKLFTARKARHNRLLFRFGEAEPHDCGLKLDPQNKGTFSDTEGFAPVRLDSSWEAQGFTAKNPAHRYPAGTPKSLIRPYDGYAWYRCKVRIPAEWKGHKLTLTGGPVDDDDTTWFNGVKIGETSNPESYKELRSYPIPETIVKFGEDNILSIRVFDRRGEGGVRGMLKVVAEDANAGDAWSPYIDRLDFYDTDAFHNW